MTNLWFYGDGNAQRVLAEILNAGGIPNVTLGNKTRPQTGVIFGSLKSYLDDDLEGTERPDLVVMGYNGGAEALLASMNPGADYSNWLNAINFELSQGITRLEAEGAKVIGVRGPTAAWRLPGLTPQLIQRGKDIDRIVEPVWRELRKSVDTIDWRLPKWDASLWSTDGVHISCPGEGAIRLAARTMEALRAYV